jgi:heptosyltransferase-2
MSRNPVKILVIRFSSLGDIVLLTSLFEALREAFPEAEIHLVTRDRYAELLAWDERIDRLIPLVTTGFGELARLRSRLARERYDLIIDAHNVIRSNLLYGTIHAGLKVQLPKDQLKKLLLIRSKLNLYRRTVHQSKRYLEMLRHIGLEVAEARTSLHLPAQSMERARTILGDRGIGRDASVALAPGARWDTKRWPLEHFIRVADAIHAEGNRIVLIGGPGEEALCAELAKRSSARPLDLSGKLSLTESAAVLSICSILVTNDSAPLHMAEAVGTPVVALFGPTVREFGYYPRLPESTVLDVHMNCRPCSRNGARPCPIGTKACLVSIEPELVLEAVRNAFSRAGSTVTGEEGHRCI